MKNSNREIRKLLISLQKEDLEYIEENIKNTIPIRNTMKFKVNGDIELSRSIREELFRLGIEPPLYSVNYDRVTYLYAYFDEVSSFQITKGEETPHYQKHVGIETTLEELKLMEKDDGK